MITYFSEKDLISFGNYCLSEARKQIYLEQGIAEDKIADLVSTVNPADIRNWFNLITKQKIEDTNTTEAKTDEG